MDQIAQQKHELYQLLTAGSLRELVRWLDIGCCKSEADDDFATQAMVRGFIAIGYELLKTQDYPTIRQTIRSAQEYALSPSEKNMSALFHDASLSYPFGPGEGCYSMESGNCDVGSGCVSGAGGLACQDIDHARVMQLLAQELIPWINGTEDPVISRKTIV